MPDEKKGGKVKPPLVSVIVPVYNVEQYLECCLDSILAQKYRNLEIILIDDGSTDASPQICDRYAARDGRIKVLHRENGGLSAARNTGLDAMKGEWVTFVDSDDYIHKDLIYLMTRAVIEDGSDMAHVLHKKTSKELLYDSATAPTHRIYGQEEYRVDILSGKLAMYSHGKLYKADLFKDIRFPEGKLYEDVPTTWEVSKLVNKVSFIGAELYFYRQRRGSIVSAPFNPRRMDQVYAAEAIYEEVRDDKVLKPIAGSRCFFSCADNYTLVTRDFPMEKDYLKNGIKKYRGDVLRDRRAGKGLKLMAMVAGIGPAPVRLLGKMYKLKQSLSHQHLSRYSFSPRRRVTDG